MEFHATQAKIQLPQKIKVPPREIYKHKLCKCSFLQRALYKLLCHYVQQKLKSVYPPQNSGKGETIVTPADWYAQNSNKH